MHIADITLFSVQEFYSHHGLLKHAHGDISPLYLPLTSSAGRPAYGASGRFSRSVVQGQGVSLHRNSITVIRREVEAGKSVLFSHTFVEGAGKKSVYNENKESWRGLRLKSHELFHSDPFWSEREHHEAQLDLISG